VGGGSSSGGSSGGGGGGSGMGFGGESGAAGGSTGGSGGFTPFKVTGSGSGGGGVVTGSRPSVGGTTGTNTQTTYVVAPVKECRTEAICKETCGSNYQIGEAGKDGCGTCICVKPSVTYSKCHNILGKSILVHNYHQKIFGNIFVKIFCRECIAYNISLVCWK
jgi:hypothetical protein